MKNKNNKKSILDIYEKLKIDIDRIPRPHKESFEDYAYSFRWPKMDVPSIINFNVQIGSSDNSNSTLKKYAELE